MVQLAPRDMNRVLSPEDMEKFQKYSFSQAASVSKDISWCPTADCGYAFIYEAGVDSNYFECARCNKCYCLTCKAQYHEGLSCKEYQAQVNPDKNEEAFLEFVRG